MSGEADEPATVLLRDEYLRRYGKLLSDGWILVDYTDDGKGQRVRAFESMIAFDSIMIGSFSIAVTLAALTYKYISKADKLSSQAVYLQYKLLIAVCAQTFVPLLFVYLPYLGVNHLAFLRLPAHSIDRACMQLTACFPAWDAIIIICLIKDYREGLLSIIRPTTKIIQVETTWRTKKKKNERKKVTAITPTASRVLLNRRRPSSTLLCTSILVISLTNFTSDFKNTFGGVVVNEVLLYAIRRFSRPSMGTYKYLLAAFATFDVFLSLLHAATRPTVVIVDKVFGVVTDCYFEEDRLITSAFSASFTVPFALMNIHFLYRFWAIRYPHRITLFSNKKFITFISAIPLLDFSLCNKEVPMYLNCTLIMSGEVGKSGTVRVRDEYERRYGKVLENSWMLVNFAAEDGLRARAFASMIIFDIIMIGSFSIAIALATLTYKYISQADKLSAQSLNLQYKLLFAICTQTFVPLSFVYLPYLGVNHLAFLRISAQSIDTACMHLNACFPAWDAIIIIALIKDYREGILSIACPTTTVIQVETTWRTTAVTMIPCD